jgi:sugar lactone lactonase YvrE
MRRWFILFALIGVGGWFLSACSNTGNGWSVGPSSANSAAATPNAATQTVLAQLTAGVPTNTPVPSATACASGAISTLAGNGALGFSGDNGPATAAKLYDPWGVAVDGFGNVFFAEHDGHRIRRVDSAGIITTRAGLGLPGYFGDGGAAISAYLSWPNGAAVDGSGNLYIADYGNGRIRKVGSGGVINTLAGNGAAGFSGEGGQAAAAALNGPTGVAVDGMGNVYVADELNARVRKVDSTGVITTLAGNGITGYSGDGGPATAAALDVPVGVAADGFGNVYIVERVGNRVRKVDSTGVITTLAGNGVAGYSGDGGPATGAELHGPTGLAADGSGNVYIADWGNNRIRKVAGGIITTLVGCGVAGYSGDGGAASAAELNGPSGVAVDAVGNLFIADWGNQRIRKVWH